MKIKASDIKIIALLIVICALIVVGLFSVFDLIKVESEIEELTLSVTPIEKQDIVTEVVVEEQPKEVMEIPVVDAIVTDTEKEENIYHISDSEYIAMVINAEAGNQDEVGKRLVADVILNRVDSIYFPDTIEAVIFQKDQFAKPSQTYTDRELELAIEEMERRIDNDIVAFRRYEYHKNNKYEDAYVHGAHYFSKFKEEYNKKSFTFE